MSLSVRPDQESLFEEVYSECAARVYGAFARSYPDLAEDLTQETFLNIYRIMGRRTFEHGDLVRYLWASVRTKLYETVRVMGRRGAIVALDDGVIAREAADRRQEEEPEAEVRVSSRERLALVRKLTPQQRQCALLRGQGFSGREIATLLGISTNTVKTHLRLAREELKRLTAETAAASMPRRSHDRT